MLKARSPIFRRDRGTSKSLFVAYQRAECGGMSETGVSSCDRYWLMYVSCVTANTTSSRDWKPLEFSAADHAASSSTQYALPHKGLATAAAPMWTSGDPRYSRPVGQARKNCNESGSDTTSELLTN